MGHSQKKKFGCVLCEKICPNDYGGLYGTCNNPCPQGAESSS